MTQVEAVDFTNTDVHALLAKAEKTLVAPIGDYEDRILHRAENPREFTGLLTPWGSLEDKLRIREGELSILGAYNGAGKTTFSCQLAVHLAQFVPVGIASLEMEIEDLGVMMAQQANHSDHPPPDAYKRFLSWAQDRIAVYDRLDVIKPEEALGCLHHMIVDLGCKFLVLDSLMMVGVIEDNDDARRFVQSLAAMAKQHHVHIMLVHHMKKPQTKPGEAPRMPGKYDLLGSSHLSNMAMTILIWWMDEEQRDAKNFGEADPSKPDYKLRIAKQRFGQFQGTLNFYESKGRCFSSSRSGEIRHIDMGVAA